MSEQTPETPAPDAAPEADEQEQPTSPQQQPTEDSPEETEASDQGWDADRAKEKIRKINSENKALRDRATKAEEKAASADELQAQAQTLESENLRLRVGYELGLPYNLAVRLQGTTREELLTDAEALVELVAPTKPTSPASGRPVQQLKPGATAEPVVPAQDDSYPADFLPRRMRERMAAGSTD